MAAGDGMREITSGAQLRELLGEASPRSFAKERARLHETDRKWLAASPFCLIATADADGNCDVSPNVKGHRPQLALLIEVEQIFFHCQKSFMRAGLWEPESWAADALPSHARLMKSLPHSTEPLAELERHYGAAYRKGLYG